MSAESGKKIGLIIGDEQEWTEAFLQGINASEEDVQAELVKLGGTFMDEECVYDVIVDRMSHEIPYYHAFLKYALMQGVYVVNNPFAIANDSKFFGTGLSSRLGLKTPRTVVLPNKTVDNQFLPASFRNLKYPMDWDAVIDYVGVPAILKDDSPFGRRRDYRVFDVEDLLERYDGSGTKTKVLQQYIDSDNHVHAFVVGQEDVLLMRYLTVDGRYHAETLSSEDPANAEMVASALKITRAYQYDINMVEFVIDDEAAYLINGTNPYPMMNTKLMSAEQFSWCVSAAVKMGIERAFHPHKQYSVFHQEES